MTNIDNTIESLQEIIDQAKLGKKLNQRLFLHARSRYEPAEVILENIINERYEIVKLLEDRGVILKHEYYHSCDINIINYLKKIIPYNDKRKDIVELAKKIYPQSSTEFYDCTITWTPYNDEYCLLILYDNQIIKKSFGKTKEEIIENMLNELIIKDVSE